MMDVETTDPEIATLRERLEEYRQVCNFGPEKCDLERAKKLYKQDEDFVAYDPAPPTGGFHGWTEYWTAYARIFDKYSIVRVDWNDDLKVFRRGDVAWSSCSGSISGVSRGGDDFHKDMRGTMVWVKEDDVWLVTQEHWSVARTIPLANGEMV